MQSWRILIAADTALVVEFGDRADLQINAKVLSLAHRLDALQIAGVVETVPTIRSLIVYYEPTIVSAELLQSKIFPLLQSLDQFKHPGRLWRLPVCYDCEVAPDLQDVAARTGLSKTQVVERHSAVTYHAYMLGFLPGLAYLGDLPEELVLSRRDTPRPRIAAGSVGIGGKMTCVYPMETPCGWHLIGRSPATLWDRNRASGALLAPGDKIRFQPIGLREYEQMLLCAEQGTLDVAPIQ
jgi:inhibitor of KinA